MKIKTIQAICVGILESAMDLDEIFQRKIRLRERNKPFDLKDVLRVKRAGATSPNWA